MATTLALTPLDPRYPSRIAHLEDAPPCISWSGGELEAQSAVAIVGSREATVEALAFASEISAALVRANVVVVSGGAVGIDAAAHQSALRCGGRTWAVAGTGPDRCYPACHAVLFETIARGPGAMLWPFETGHRGAFLARNRVLVALADAVVVVQAGLLSGALNAASWARALSKPLWVVPAAPWTGHNFAGSLRLLEEGARPLTSVDLLLGSLGLDTDVAAAATDSAQPQASAPEHSISANHSQILGFMSHLPLHMDAITVRTGQSAQAVAAALLTLALENVVVEGPPGFFRRRNVSRR